MADPLSFLVGVLVLSIAAGLHFLGGRELPSLGSSASDERLVSRRRWTRYLVSTVMLVAAAAAMAAGALGPSLVWALLWVAIPLLLLLAVVLAVVDATRVRSLYIDRLPELIDESRLDEEPS